jgi:hypothetical protein
MDLNKEFLGRVVYNEDPTFSGRCKVRVFGLFDTFEVEEIPWFVPQSSNQFSSGNGYGNISIPKLGSIVRIKFQNGNIYSGEYGNIQNIDPALIEEIKDDYEGTHVLCYDSEKDLIIIYQPMTGYKMWLGGSMILIDADGTIQLKHRNNSNVIEVNDSNINIATTGEGGTNSNGEINIAAGATVNINVPTANINASSIMLGENASATAVKGEKLIQVLQQIVTELNTKYPMGVSTLAGRDFKEILSDTVKLN